MNWVVTIYTALLFFVLTPSVFFRFPANGSKMKVAAVHGLLFAVVWHFTHKFVWRMSVGMEGMTLSPTAKANAQARATAAKVAHPNAKANATAAKANAQARATAAKSTYQ
jgi:hypothetical protein